ncbi:MAG TPA: cytochrome c3 family protein [Clostridia bacterium]|nr:cytochrome c3 family protein [Clostridia bacterium]
MKNTNKMIAVVVCALVVLVCGSMLFAQEKAPGTVILKGAAMGGVKFDHKAHATNKCAICHHASKPERPAKAKFEACADCHTKTVAAPMKTKAQAAFHNPAAQAGVCIDCHKAENAKGKKVPMKCTDCHKKENV